MMDVRIQSDLMSALLAFAEGRNQQVYFNGFAIYCMEIACSFLHEYNNNVGGLPPGLDEASLVKNNNLMLYTEKSIGEYRDKRKIHQDFQDFYKRISGSYSNTELQNKLRDAKQELQTTKENNKRLQKIVDEVRGPIVSMQSTVNQLNAKMDLELQRNGKVVDTLTANQLFVTNLIPEIKNAVTEMKNAGSIDQAQFDIFFNTIKDRLDIIEKINGIGNFENAVVSFVHELQRENAELKRKINELETSGVAPGGGQPAAALSQKTKDLINLCETYSQFNFGANPPKIIDQNLFADFDTDFQSLDAELPAKLKKILEFCRDSFCFFYSFEKFKRKRIQDLNSSAAKNLYKFHNDKFLPYFESAIWCSRSVLEKTQKVFEAIPCLKEEITYKLKNVHGDQTDLQINGFDAHKVQIEVSSIRTSNEQWKQSFLHAECTYHSMKHQLMFMFTLHVLRLVQHIANMDNLDSKIKSILQESLPILNEIFGSIMNIDMSSIDSKVYNQEYSDVISDFFSSYNPTDARKTMYPLSLFHAGAYMKYTTMSYPYDIDDTTKKANFKLLNDNNNVLMDQVNTDENQLCILLFYQLLANFKDASKQPSDPLLFRLV